MNTDEFDDLTERVLGAVFDLRASGRTLCLLVNFQKPKVEWKRIVRGFQLTQPILEPPLAG